MNDFQAKLNDALIKLGFERDEDAAAFLECSVNNVRRWRQGVVIPPAANMILRLLQEAMDKKG